MVALEVDMVRYLLINMAVVCVECQFVHHHTGLQSWCVCACTT